MWERRQRGGTRGRRFHLDAYVLVEPVVPTPPFRHIAQVLLVHSRDVVLVLLHTLAALRLLVVVVLTIVVSVAMVR